MIPFWQWLKSWNSFCQFWVVFSRFVETLWPISARTIVYFRRSVLERPLANFFRRKLKVSSRIWTFESVFIGRFETTVVATEMSRRRMTQLIFDFFVIFKRRQKVVVVLQKSILLNIFRKISVSVLIKDLSSATESAPLENLSIRISSFRKSSARVFGSVRRKFGSGGSSIWKSWIL